MNRYAYVLTTQLLQQQVGSAALAAVLEMAKATKPDEDGIANLIEAWMVTVGGVKFHAGLNLASIAKTSLDNARTGKRPAGSSTELQVRRVSYPRPLSRLLRDLEGGRAIAIVLSGVGSVAVAAWCIVDTNPAAAPESYVRDLQR